MYRKRKLLAVSRLSWQTLVMEVGVGLDIISLLIKEHSDLSFSFALCKTCIDRLPLVKFWEESINQVLFLCVFFFYVWL